MNIYYFASLNQKHWKLISAFNSFKLLQTEKYNEETRVCLVSGLNTCKIISCCEQLLLQFWGLVCFSFQNGLNALHLAAKEGHVGLVQELLGRGSSVDSATKVIFMLVELISLEKRKWFKVILSGYIVQRLAGTPRFLTMKNWNWNSFH